MLGTDYQVAEAPFLALADLPVLVGTRVAELLHREATVFYFFGVDEVDIGAVVGVLEFFCLLFDVGEDVLVEVGGGRDLKLLDFGVEEAVDFVLSCAEVGGGGGFEEYALVRDEEVDVVG